MLKSLVGFGVFGLTIYAVWIVVGAVVNWFLLVFAVPLVLTVSALYLLLRSRK